MLRKFARGLMIVALAFGLQSARALGADDSNIAAEVHTALQTLNTSGDRTAASRINLAKVAISSASATRDPKAALEVWQAARDALAEALRLEPANKEALDLMSAVMKHIPATPPTPPPATNPAPEKPTTKPGPETQPAAAAADFTVKRMVTPAEINRIRQLEWRHDENPPPVIRIAPEEKKKFLAADPDVTPVDFNKSPIPAQAATILDSGKDDFYHIVEIKTDPASMREFRRPVEQTIVQMCGNCHNNNKAGRFSLFTDHTDAAVYSNFIILQKYSAFVGGAQRLVVDRTTPEASLLLEFMLPSDLTNTPHPAVNNQPFKPPVKSKSDPRFQMILKWLKTLDPLSPNYGIDLSSPAPAGPVAVPPKK
jgi:hypothetical protein